MKKSALLFLALVMALVLVICCIYVLKYKNDSIDVRMIKAIDAQYDINLLHYETCRIRLGDVYDSFSWDTAVIFEEPYDSELYPSLGIEDVYFDNGIAFYHHGNLVKIFYTKFRYNEDLPSVISFQVNRYYSEEPYVHQVRLTPDSYVYVRKEKYHSGPTVFDEFWRYIVSAY